MNEELKLILALQQVDNLTNLLHKNEYDVFLYGHLTSIKCELERQLTNIKANANILK